jgi:methylmalonyl-CoA mutase N-terminal domain/subunit
VRVHAKVFAAMGKARAAREVWGAAAAEVVPKRRAAVHRGPAGQTWAAQQSVERFPWP